MSPLTRRQIRARGAELAAGHAGQRIGLRVSPEKVLYYDIDPDGTVYWLLPRHSGRLERRRVSDPRFAEFVRLQAKQALAQAKEPT